MKTKNEVLTLCVSLVLIFFAGVGIAFFVDVVFLQAESVEVAEPNITVSWVEEDGSYVEVDASGLTFTEPNDLAKKIDDLGQKANDIADRYIAHLKEDLETTEWKLEPNEPFEIMVYDANEDMSFTIAKHTIEYYDELYKGIPGMARLAKELAGLIEPEYLRMIVESYRDPNEPVFVIVKEPNEPNYETP